MSGHHPPRRTLRRIGAVFIGLVAVVVLSLGTDAALHAAGVYPPWGRPMSDRLFVLASAYRAAWAVLGSYIAARLAPDRPMAHAMALGVVGLLLSIAGAAATWRQLGAGSALGPAWYPLSLVATALPCSWAGGRVQAWACSKGADSRRGA